VKFDKFKTLCAFFRIDYVNDRIAGAISSPDAIYIDEFSLINKRIFQRCISLIRKDCEVILCGDIMQLSAIHDSSETITFREIYSWKEKSRIDNLYPEVLEHLHMSIISIPSILDGEIMYLTKRYRFTSTVLQIIDKIYFNSQPVDDRSVNGETVDDRSVNGETVDDRSVNEIPVNKQPVNRQTVKRTPYNKHSIDDRSFNMQSVDEEFFNDLFLNYFQVIDYLKNKDFVFIASKYEILQRFYDQTARQDSLLIKNSNSFRYSFKTLHLFPDCKLISTLTIKELKIFNGEDLIFKKFENENIICERNEGIVKIERVNGYFPVMPSNFLTVHKSQGRNIENVIACIDDLFGFSMFYTQITRAMKNLHFYSVCPANERYNKIISVAHVEKFNQLRNIVSNRIANRHNEEIL
jgi:hypothetical protein